MIKVGFITAPLNSGHSVRGVGFYTRNLLTELLVQGEKQGFKINPIHSASSGFDLIHYPNFDLFTNSLPYKKVAKTIVTIHDVIPLEYPNIYPPGIKGYINLQLQKFSLKSVAGVITDSYASVNSVHKYLGTPNDRIKLIYLAASDKFRPRSVSDSLVQKYRLPKIFVLYVGDINWNKNIPSLVKACLFLKLDLVMVGKQSSRLDELDISHPELKHVGELKKLVTSPLIHRIGFVPDDDLVGIYNLATIYCQPSFVEGFGLPVLEAMSCGTPVVCSNTSSLPEIAGDAAEYFDPQVETGLQQSLTRVINDPNLQKQLSNNGLIQAKKFSWKETANNTLLAYKNFI